MKIFTKLSLAIGAVAFLCPQTGAVRPVDMYKEKDVRAMMRAMAPDAGAFDTRRVTKVQAISQKMEGELPSSLRAPISPDVTIGPADAGIYDIDGPNGELWYYSRHLTSIVESYEHYDELVLTEYRFDIYDSSLNLVGSIHDKMRYRSDEVRVPGPEAGIDILPVVTRHFFNPDDNYEIVISLAVNTVTPGINRYRSLIYSLDGEKEKVTVYNPATGLEDREFDADVPCGELQGLVGDVLDVSNGGDEELYMSFLQEQYNNIDDLDWEKLYDVENIDPVEGQKYWDAVSTNKVLLQMKGKADADGNLTDVMEWEVPVLCQQGNCESTPLMFTFVRNGVAYAVCPRYKEIFYNPYYSPLQDMTMRENNLFVIDLYKISDGKPELLKTTEIPMELSPNDDALFTYYGVGRLRYNQDVDFDCLGTEDSPAYYITRSYYAISTDDENDFCYYVYGTDGSLLKTIFEHADSNLSLTDVEGLNPMHLFISYDEVNGYTYNFVDLVEGFHKKRTVQINYLLDGEDVILANSDRVPMADAEGGYKIAFEMRVPGLDDDENDLMRIVWFDAQGNFDRMDYVNMGKNIFYAQSYIYGPALNPELFDGDKETPEYMVLLKRGLDPTGVSTESQEELLVARPISQMHPNGFNMLNLVPNSDGVLRQIGLYSLANNTQSLFVTRLGDRGYTAEFYKLPFDMSAIDEITVDGKKGTVAFDGSMVYSEGKDIQIYTAEGRLIAKGVGSVSVKAFPAGVYVVISGNDILKFIK